MYRLSGKKADPWLHGLMDSWGIFSIVSGTAGMLHRQVSVQVLFRKIAVL